MIIREGQASLKRLGLYVRDEYLMQRAVQAGLAAGEIIFPQGGGKAYSCRRLIGGNCILGKPCCFPLSKAEQRFRSLNQFNGGNLITLFAHNTVLLLPLSIYQLDYTTPARFVNAIANYPPPKDSGLVTAQP